MWGRNLRRRRWSGGFPDPVPWTVPELQQLAVPDFHGTPHPSEQAHVESGRAGIFRCPTCGAAGRVPVVLDDGARW